MKIRLCFLIVVVPLLIGCGGTYDSYVAGVVTLDSSSLQRGTVSFKPIESGPTAYGFITEGGTYVLKTGLEEGLPSGKYVVAVVANEPSVANEEGALPSPGKPITPQWYRSAKTSGLDFTVEEGSSEINIELTSEPPADWNPPKKKGRR